MREIKISFSINSLYEYSEDFSFKINNSLDNCDNIINSIDSNSQVVKIPKNNNVILFDLYNKFIDIGYVDVFLDSEYVYLSDDVDYVVSGQTTSQLDVLRTYNGTLIENLNMSDNNSYSAVINNNPSYIEYVIGGEIDNGVYVNNTGLIYRDYEDRTEYYYYPSKIKHKIYTHYFKNGDTLNSLYDLEIENEDDLFIDRGGSVFPLGYHLILSELNNTDELDNINIKII